MNFRIGIQYTCYRRDLIINPYGSVDPYEAIKVKYIIDLGVFVEMTLISPEISNSFTSSSL